jgi:addiction module HigA family antidote
MIKRMKPPVHPGIILREDVIKEYGLTVTDAAKMLGVTRSALSDVLNAKAAISAEMAFLQMKYHNWFAEEKIKSLKLKPFKPSQSHHGYA